LEEMLEHTDVTIQLVDHGVLYNRLDIQKARSNSNNEIKRQRVKKTI
jgi:hypothetical protein